MPHDRASAWALLTEWTISESLRRHALAVEAAMRAHARRLGVAEEPYGIVGLLHDFDYERHPDPKEHAAAGARVLRAAGWPEEWVRAIEGHNPVATGVARTDDLGRCLFACDELCGFLQACALVRPEKRIATVPVDSALKRMKDKAFARAVNRDEIRQGAAEIGLELAAHIVLVRDAMATVAAELGLAG